MSENENEGMDITEELARIINPEAYADEAGEFMDVPLEQATARLYASRVAAWLTDHDADLTRRARQAYALEAGRVLLDLLPKVNPAATPTEGEQ